jgi:lipid II:glycine glycyltransferase (peptidoglycan interpeptide bridge formation enzyme)
MANWANAIGAKPQALPDPPGPYTVEIGQIGQDRWNAILQNFDDANLLQTSSYSSVRWGRNSLSHLVLRHHGEIVSAVQVVIKTVPLLGAGIAYIKSGPLWQPRGTGKDLEILRQMLRELRRVYVIQRGLLLRIFPADIEGDAAALSALFEEEGFSRDVKVPACQTAVIDLSYSLDELRASLRPTWRRNLVLSERNNLSVVEGTSTELFDAFATLYRESLTRKRGVATVGVDRFIEIQKDLPAALKMRIMLCQFQGEPVSGAVVPCLGKTALNLLSATAEKGLNLRASYFLQWRLLPWLKQQGCRFYDLNYVDPQNYPGITQFKSGLAGRLGFTSEYLGPFESCGRSASRVSVNVGVRLNTAYQKMRRQL